jgi:hypothetical protein
MTGSGRKLVPALAALADRNDEEFFGFLRRDEVANLTKMLKAIVHRHGLKSAPVD